MRLCEVVLGTRLHAHTQSHICTLLVPQARNTFITLGENTSLIWRHYVVLVPHYMGKMKGTMYTAKVQVNSCTNGQSRKELSTL